MIRATSLGVAALVAAGPAFAEGGSIRSGEHADFSRIVMVIEPTTEWSLETSGDRASIFFPGRALEFGTSRVFEKIPQTRIGGVRSAVGPDGTTVEIDIGCDCRVSASFVGATYLALDVADRTAAPEPGTDRAGLTEPEEEDVEARAEREASVVASAEAALIQQIERAVSQGLIELNRTGPDAAAGTDPRLQDLALAPPDRAPAPPARPADVPEPRLDAESPEIGAGPENSMPDALEALLDHDQIEATTVFDRDRPVVGDHLKAAVVPMQCLPDERLEVGRWSNGTALFDQRPALASRLVGEFDRPDADSVAELAQLYIRFGFGAESEQVLLSFDTAVKDRDLLLDLSRAVERRTVAADGPLALPAACPGRHGLWLALGGVAPVFHDALHFSTVQAAFAELPPDLRALVGPTLIDRLLDAGRTEQARLIYDTTTRPGMGPSADLRLSEARLVAAEGAPKAAIEALDMLVEENAHNAISALDRLVALAIEGDIPIPQRTLLDLRAAVIQSRGTDREPLLRIRLAEALAQRAELGEAVAELRALEGDFPEMPGLGELATGLMAAADPDRVGAAGYAEIVLGSADLVGPTPRNDAARAAMARNLLAIGLPRAAVDMVMPAAGRDDGARLTLAEGLLRMGQPARARLVLTGLGGVEAAQLRARALAQDGDFAGANASLKGRGMVTAATPYAWPSGDWERARQTAPTPEQQALAEFMGVRAGDILPQDSADMIEDLGPTQAFVEPLPNLDRPSLASARRLLSKGRQIGDLVGTVLTDATPDVE